MTTKRDNIWVLGIAIKEAIQSFKLYFMNKIAILNTVWINIAT